jgi:hypothetical protein
MAHTQTAADSLTAGQWLTRISHTVPVGDAAPGVAIYPSPAATLHVVDE